MIEYTVLTTFAVILAVSTLWTIRTAKTIGRKLYNAFLPSSKSNLRIPVTDDELPTLSGELQCLAMPWGWRESPYRNKQVILQPPVQAQIVPTPWGWPGSKVADSRNFRPGVLQQLSDRLQQEIRKVEIPFARNYNAVKISQIQMLTYFSKDDGMLRFPVDNSEKDRGFQLPWGW